MQVHAFDITNILYSSNNPKTTLFSVTQIESTYLLTYLLISNKIDFKEQLLAIKA